MPLDECQVQVRDLVMGPGTLYDLQDEFNPFRLAARASQGGPRAWNHGTWSGAEFADARVVPMRVIVNGANRDVASWLASHQALAAAFRPVGDETTQVEMRFTLGGTEYVLFGRPALSESEMRNTGLGYAYTRCAFVAQDPRIYSGELFSVQTGLPVQTGGLTVPLTVPFTIDGVLTGGQTVILNSGTTDSPVTFRIDGPVVSPVVALQRPDGTIQQVRFDLTLASGQWLDVSTAARTALLNGLPQANQRGRAIWDMDPYPLPPGTSTLRYLAGSFNVTTEVSASWRSAYW